MRGKLGVDINREITDLYPRLWRYCLVLTSNRANADDLAQAVCLRAIEKQHQFEKQNQSEYGSGFDRWVFRIAKTIWINELRAATVRRGGGLVAIEDAELFDQKPDAETNLFASQVLLKVMQLPEAQRTTLFFAYVEGYSYKETAAFLEIPIGTVMSRLSAARKTINTELEKTTRELGTG